GGASACTSPASAQCGRGPCHHGRGPVSLLVPGQRSGGKRAGRGVGDAARGRESSEGRVAGAALVQREWQRCTPPTRREPVAVPVRDPPAARGDGCRPCP